MQELIDDFVEMNTSGRVLELCEKYYDEHVLMLNNGTVFAKSMQESYDKQKECVGSVEDFEVKLISSEIEGNVSELVFRYRMTGSDAVISEFTGKHIQTWEKGKIVREEYSTIS